MYSQFDDTDLQLLYSALRKQYVLDKDELEQLYQQGREDVANDPDINGLEEVIDRQESMLEKMEEEIKKRS
jgi:hypothetical protein